MNGGLMKLATEYDALLRDYLASGGEAYLERATELGRQAMTERIGLLDVAGLHGDVVATFLATLSPDSTLTMCKAGDLLAAVLAPFEMAHRGFRDAVMRLEAANVELERRRELERRDAAVEINRTTTFFSEILDSLRGVAVFTYKVDGDRRLTYASKSIGALTGVSAAELTGDPLRWLALLPQEPRGSAAAEREYRLACPDGRTRDLLDIRREIQLPGERTLRGLGVLVDITERVAAEEARKTAQVQLQQSYKLAALGEMAGGIAHEINNPLSVILGKGRQLVELIAAGRADQATVKAYVTAMTDMASRIAAIVRGLRTVSRRSDQDPFVEVTVESILDGTLAISGARFKYGDIALEMMDHPPGLTLSCRPAEISQVLLNLLSNAYDAVAEVGDLGQGRWVRLSVAAADGWLEIAVTDSGPGIPVGMREQILVPYFTTKAVGKGTGLGLSISKSIAERHGGTLRLDDTCPNTRFVLRLPQVTGPAGTRRDPSSPDR